MRPVALLVREGWGLGHSGVAVFIREVVSVWGPDGICRLVALPGGPQPSGIYVLPQTAEVRCPPVRGVIHTSPIAVRWSAMSRWVRLIAGYINILLKDVAAVWGVRHKLRGRIIITNDFGCETLPVALRIVFPFRRIVAISHTHPGQEPEAFHPVRRIVENVCAASATTVAFNSVSSQKLWCARLWKKIDSCVVHLGISAPQLQLPEDYPQKNVTSVDFVCVARFVAWKGHRQLVAAWSEALLRGLKGCRLILIGDGEVWPEIRALVNELGLESSVLMLGAKQDGSNYFNGADIAVLLSIEPEAFGLVALEAMSRSKPLIASNMGGLSEIIENDVNGLLVNPYSVADVASAIMRLAEDRVMRERFGAAGCLMWRNRFTSRDMCNNLERVLRW